MSFQDALAYPFKSRNPLKALSLTLAYAALIIGGIIFAISFQNVLGLALIGIGGLLYGLMLGGYNVRMVGTILAGSEDAPDFSAVGDMGRGFMLILAAILYYLPILVLIILGSMLSRLSKRFSERNTIRMVHDVLNS